MTARRPALAAATALVLAVAWLVLAATPASATYRFATKWGSYGTGNGQFNAPDGIAADSFGHVYVADLGNSRVEEFTSSGAYVTQWGSYGTGDGQFAVVTDVATYGTTPASSSVYVADQDNHRIQEFSPAGGYITQWGKAGSGNGEFNLPACLAVDHAGNVYVADGGNFRIEKFTSVGGFILKWGSYGTGDGQFHGQCGVAVGSSGHVYVAEANNHRIQEFTSSGAFIRKWGHHGTGDGQFGLPGAGAVATDSFGNVYVTDPGNDRIEKFTSTGRFLTTWGSFGTGDGQFDRPLGVAVDRAGNVYVTDTKNERIEKFKPVYPQTTITNAIVKSSERRARFRFRSSEDGSTFRCKLDAGDFSRCTAPKTYRHLKVGHHVFEVRAIDKDKLSDRTPAQKGFRVRK